MNASYYQTITHYFIKKLEQGIIPWRCNTGVPFHDFAQNYYSGRKYRGINWFLLNLITTQEVPYYLTSNQTNKLGGRVLKEAKKCSVFSFRSYYKSTSGKRLAVVQAQQLEALKDKDVQRVSYWIRYQLVPIHQTECIAWELPTTRFPRTPKELLAHMQEKPVIKYYDLNEHYYDPKADEIIFPHTSKGAEYDSYLLFVNLIHWTGHEMRLARPGITRTPSDCSYEVEEQFIADIGASFLCRMIGQALPFQIQEEHSADIMTLWIQTLEEDNRFLFRVASKVQKAVEYILGLNKEQVV